MRARRHRLAFILLIAITLTITLAPERAHLPLDPDEPMAADGSLAAGRARTIFDFEPLLGAFDEPKPSNSDDPQNVAERIKLEQPWAERAREPIRAMLGPIDGSLCEPAKRKRLMAAVRTYYDARGRQKASFALRGPNGRAAIARAWSTPLDQQIDTFVRQAVLSGVLHKDEAPARSLREFAAVVADTREIGAACPRLKIERVTGDLSSAQD